jgi:hypothetical protein
MEGIAADNAGKYVAPTAAQFSQSVGVTITPVIDPSGNGWSATAVHGQLPGTSTCGIFVNAALPTGMPAATKEGEAVCW